MDGTMLNGNALYCVNEEVLGYLEHVKSAFPPVGCHDAPRRANRGRSHAQRTQLWGFDTVQYWYRVSVEQRSFMQGRMHQFQSVDWIADLHRMGRAEIEQYIQTRPSLVLLHSKSYFNNTRSSWDMGGDDQVRPFSSHFALLGLSVVAVPAGIFIALRRRWISDALRRWV